MLCSGSSILTILHWVVSKVIIATYVNAFGIKQSVRNIVDGHFSGVSIRQGSHCTYCLCTKPSFHKTISNRRCNIFCLYKPTVHITICQHNLPMVHGWSYWRQTWAYTWLAVLKCWKSCQQIAPTLSLRIKTWTTSMVHILCRLSDHYWIKQISMLSVTHLDLSLLLCVHKSSAKSNWQHPLLAGMLGQVGKNKREGRSSTEVEERGAGQKTHTFSCGHSPMPLPLNSGGEMRKGGGGEETEENEEERRGGVERRRGRRRGRSGEKGRGRGKMGRGGGGEGNCS